VNPTDINTSPPNLMKTPPFLGPDDESRVLQAIRLAETGTTGEIRVCLASQPIQDVQARARQAFERLGMHQTRDRNGVLLYIAPACRSLAILGDDAIHARCGDAFWHHIADDLSAEFARNAVVPGLVRAITELGEVLARHFPRQPGDTNELPDSIAHDLPGNAPSSPPDRQPPQ